MEIKVGDYVKLIRKCKTRVNTFEEGEIGTIVGTIGFYTIQFNNDRLLETFNDNFELIPKEIAESSLFKIMREND